MLDLETELAGWQIDDVPMPSADNSPQIGSHGSNSSKVHNLNGSTIATQNRFETIEAASHKANGSSFENPVAATPFGEDTNPLPQSLPNCSAPLVNASPIAHSLTSAVEARPMIEPRHSSGQQFITNQRFELKNNIIDPDTARAFQWIEDQLLHDDEQYVLNYMQFDSCTADRLFNSFQALLHEGDHAHVRTQRIHDLQSQNSVQPARRTLFPRSEPDLGSHIQPFFVPVAPNSHAHQHGYRAALPKPTVPNSVPVMSPNYHPHPSLHAMTYNSFGSGLQFSRSQGVPHQMNEHNPSLNTPTFQQRNYTLHEPKALSSTSQKGLQAPMSSVTDELKEYYEIRRKLLDMRAKAEQTVTPPNYPQQNRRVSFAPIKIAAPLESTVAVEQDKQPRRRGRPPKSPGHAESSPKPPARRGRPPKRCDSPNQSFPPSKHPRM